MGDGDGAWVDGPTEGHAPVRPGKMGGAPAAPSLAAMLSEARRIRLLLDYDGTLVPIAPAPDLAVPDREVLALLTALAYAPAVQLGLVSGRLRSSLDGWFGHLPVSLWGEHGLWHRPASSRQWRAAAEIDPGVLDAVRPIFERFTARTPGAFVELKSASIAWHFRGAEPESGARRARELCVLLAEALSGQPLEVIEGRKVIEARLRGVSKAIVARGVQAGSVAGSLVVAIGDDLTDEDLFSALPSSCATVVVGHRPSCARFRLADHLEVRRLLRGVLRTARALQTSACGSSRTSAGGSPGLGSEEWGTKTVG
jgi:trehalose 6-phosphate synthase/phosphatase